MIKRTLEQASETVVPRLVISAFHPGSTDLDRLHKTYRTRQIIRQEGLRWFLNEVYSSMIHRVYLDPSYKVDKKLDPAIYEEILASVAAKASLTRVEPLGAPRPAIRHVSPLEFLEELQRLFYDPPEYLVMSAYYLMGWGTKEIQDKYGLDLGFITHTIQAGFQILRNETILRD